MTGHVNRTIIAVAIAALCCGTAAAQDRPTVFIHGLGSGPDTWNDTASRLSGRLAIAPHVPPLSWRSVFESQADEVQGWLWNLPSNPIAIGHSNGGIVARQWSRTRPLGGIVTLGTPNQGAPLAGNLLTLAQYQWGMGALISDVYNALSVSWDGHYVLTNVEWWMHAAYGLADASYREVLTTVGVAMGAPVVPQMAVSSPYLASLNSDANTSREAAGGARVAIVSIADNFYDLGVFGAIAGNNAEYFDALTDGAVAVLDYYAAYILGRADPMDFDAHRRAQRLWNLAGWINSWDAVWCRAVSSPGAAFCAPNDTVVPAWSQVMPGSAVHVLDWGWSGPRHTFQTHWSDDKLYQALTALVGVPPRGSGAPGGGTGGTGGGAGGAGGAGTLAPDTRLLAGQSVLSPQGRLDFMYQHDGNLVLYRSDGVPVWASHTAGTSPGQTVMQGDGNLVIYDGSSRPIWHSGTHGQNGASLRVQDDGKVVIYGVGGAPLWSSSW